MTATAKMIEPAGKQTIYVPILTQPTPEPGRSENTHLEVTLRYQKKVGYILSAFPVSVEEGEHFLSVGYGFLTGLIGGSTKKNIQPANRLNSGTLAKLWDACAASIKHRVGEAWDVVSEACAKLNVTV